MQEYNARLIRVIDGGTVELDIDLGLNDIHIYRVVYLSKISVPSTDSKLSEDKNKGLAAKQRLTDLLEKAENGIVKIKAEEDKDNIYVIIYIGGMNVNKTLVNDGYAKGTGF